MKRGRKVILFATSMFLGLSLFAQTITPFGNIIDGESPGDQFGNSVAISSNGLIVASGAREDLNASGLHAGSVRVFEWEGSSWNQRGSTIIGDSAEDRSGMDIDLSADGNVLIIGAPWNDVNGERAGQVRVFEWVGSDWVQRGNSLYGDRPFDLYGGSVAISNSGDTIVIGASGFDSTWTVNDWDDRGLVRAYHWNGVSWNQLGADIIGSQDDAEMGSSCEISGDGKTIIIGAPFYDAPNELFTPPLNGTIAGQIQVYSFDGSNWVKKGDDIYGTTNGKKEGQLRQVDISDDGDRIVVSSTASNGVVRTFEWNGVNWNQYGNTLEGNNIDFFGKVSLSSDGNRLLVGAYGNSYFSLFSWDGANWNQIGNNVAVGLNSDRFGFSAGLSDSTFLVVGAPYKEVDGVRQGQIRLYEFCAPFYVVDSIEACDSYTWINGITYNSSTNLPAETISSGSCDTIITLNLTIINTPAVSFTGLSSNYLPTDNAVNLIGSPLGGTFSGPGVLGDTFDPSAAGLGSHSIIYTFTSGNCVVTDTQIVVVSNAPTYNYEIIISAVFDGPLTAGTPKGVELFVGQDIADLSQFGLGSANNGGGTDGVEFIFPSAAVTSGTYLYVASESPEFNNFFGFLPDYADASMGVNGNDAVELFKNGEVIDVFGDINIDGTGQSWEYTDGWASRNDCAEPNFGVFNSSDWNFSGINALDGELTNATASTPIPIGIFSCAPPCPAVNSIDVQTACSSYVWIDGNIYTSSNNTATYTIEGGASTGCDSIVTLNLTINSLDTEVIISNDTLIAQEIGVTYQWLDCNNGYSPIIGATSQEFAPTLPSDYSVEITNINCIDTSACYTAPLVLNFDDKIGGKGTLLDKKIYNVYPNPSSGQFYVEISDSQINDHLKIINIFGQELYNLKLIRNINEINIDLPNGLYLLLIGREISNIIINN